MPECMKIEIMTLTPIWTGGVDGKPDRLQETGIIGGMRWWYEAIVRGIGGYACDPTSDKRCELSGREKTHEERLAKLCPACYLFGCTGWKRRFRLDVQSNTTVPFQLATLEGKNRFNHWWLSQIFEDCLETKLPFGKLSLSFTCGEDEVINQTNALLSIMAHIGAAGSKTQYGFGQFDWDNKMDLADAINAIRKFLSYNTFKSGSNEDKWYSSDKFWSYEFSVSSDNELLKKFQNANIIGNGSMPNNYLPVSFDIRYKIPSSRNGNGLRESFYSYCLNQRSIPKDKAKQETRKIFGTLENDKLGSRVFVSHLFKKSNAENSYWLRVWGFADDSVGKIIGEELEKIFKLNQTLSMINGKEILDTCGGGTQ